MLLGAMYLESDGKAALIVRECLCVHALLLAQHTQRKVAAGHLERLLVHRGLASLVHHGLNVSKNIPMLCS